MMTLPSHLRIGLNGRFFPNNWRPALDEIAFAQAHGFEAIQVGGKEEGLNAEHLGANLDTVGAALKAAGIMPVMEIMVRVGADGRTPQGHTVVDILRTNLDAITSLGCRCVHWHAVPLEPLSAPASAQLEAILTQSFAEGVSLVRPYDVRLGYEHNEPSIGLFSTPDACARALVAVHDLWFVWDINHTTPEHHAGFRALLGRTSMLHVSDTPLPEVNYHLPLGMGTVDYPAVCHALRRGGFRGPAILEIGGLPKSGGFNRDTDAALVDSRDRLRAAYTQAVEE
jgi:L-ribulose-5-phosphate 3-epimerase